jgi:hypothetical protein
VESAWPVLSLIALALSILTFATLHVVEPKMHPLERTLSEYALTPAGKRLFPLASVSTAVAAVFLIGGLNTHDAPMTPLILLAIFAVALTLAGLVATDDMDLRKGDFEMSGSGAVHAMAEFVAIVGICVAAPWLIDTLVETGASRVTATITGWLPTAAAAVFLVTIAARGALGHLHGLGERIGFAGFLVWIGYAASIMLHP